MVVAEPHFAVAMVLRELRNARDSGHGRLGEDQLQQQTGLGREDLEAGLRELASEGRIENVAPGQWSLMVDDAGEEVAAPSREPGSADAPAPAAPRATPSATGGADVQVTEVRLTRAMVEGLDPEALGKLILSGVREGDSEFTLVVT